MTDKAISQKQIQKENKKVAFVPSLKKFDACLARIIEENRDVCES